jgi:hypothetical protein
LLLIHGVNADPLSAVDSIILLRSWLPFIPKTDDRSALRIDQADRWQVGEFRQWQSRQRSLGEDG